MISDLQTRLHEITTQETEAASMDLGYKLTDELSELPDGLDAVEPILRLMEEHPTVHFGCPGPLVHFVETFYHRGYEDRLCASIRRRPTPHTVWMLNRIINGTKGSLKSQYIAVLDEILARPDLDEDTALRAREYRELHQETPPNTSPQPRRGGAPPASRSRWSF